MSKVARITVFAVALLVLLFSLPFWLPNALAAMSTPAQSAAPAAEVAEVAGAEVDAQDLTMAVETSPLLAQVSEPIFLWDGGRYIGESTLTLDSPPQVIAWSPASGQAEWVHETGFSYGGIYDAGNNRIILIEQRNAASQSLEGISIPNNGIYPSAEWPLYLSILDASTGELLSATEVTGRFFNSATTGAARPVLLRGETLYLMNYGTINNFATFDLATGSLSEEKWDVCETGYPTQVAFSEDTNSVVTLCVDYSTADMKGFVSQLSLADGSVRSIELGELGSESYMGGNGLVLGQNGMAYALDNDAGVILEIDLQSMQIVRQANYTEGLAAVQPSLGERVVSWLLRQAATPAAAKRMFAVSALSLDGSTIAVTGSMLDSGTRTMHLIDVASLQATEALQAGGTPTALLFRGDDLLLAFYEREGYNSALGGMVFDLASGEKDDIRLQINGFLTDVLSVN